MEHETELQLKLNDMLDERFLGMSRSIVVTHLENGSYNVCITSSDPFFLGRLIGKKGSTIAALRAAFTKWAEDGTMKVILWVERTPVQTYD